MEHVSHSPQSPLRGTIRVPGDKSISHRAVLFSAMAEGTSHLTGVLDSADVRSTIGAVRALGAVVAEVGADERGLQLEVVGWGTRGPSAPDRAIDCGNSGTTARLLLGVLAGWPIAAVLEGDESLSSRPMTRVTHPLGLMGASFVTRDGKLPVTIQGGHLTGIRFDSPVASAQVKSAVLLAGVRASGRTSVHEPAPSRDHTERLLPLFGVQVDRDVHANSVAVAGPRALRAHDVHVPADPSSAAFLVVAALIVPESDVVLPDVALNPTRAGFVRVLQRMGADITVQASTESPSASVGEPTGTLRVRAGTALSSTLVTADEIPSLIDEIPILALAASRATGTTRFEAVGELRVKESDRLAAIQDALTTLGATVRSGEDWLEVDGPTTFAGGHVDSLGDHRLAMCWAVAGLVSAQPVRIERFEVVDVSYPRFAEDLSTLSGSPSDIPAS